LKGKITIDPEVCKGCLYCIVACPRDLIVVSDKLNSKGLYPAKFNGSPEESGETSSKSGCTGCALCAVSCPDAAIEVYREAKK
jgi:2-oxoglutarate ferredoxin oxidoreductase subunit delta